MGLMEELIGQGGGIAKMIASNPKAVAAAVSMLSSKPGSVGGTAGLGGLMNSFQQAGLGDVMASWVGTGANQSISPSQVSKAIPADMLTQFGQAAGLSGQDAMSALSSLLPALVDGLTPKGQVPQQDSLEGMLGGLMKGLGH